ncbi:MAG: UDP-N-acetylmuramoyl-L-alanine--D-glutamate ligase [Succinivibrio sp.]|jgi:UDP-N-acetylmuramoylalanine--D-glutamate ligase|nr:UDP-N-acetylmuramoyl-L-alanine--D-glutamate ligase [Succinivibrio sp.]
MNSRLNGKRIAVLGMGVSNISALRYLKRHDLKQLTVFDTRTAPPRLSDVPQGVDVRLGPWDAELLKQYDLLVLGPGVSVYTPEVAAAAEHGAQLTGDVELFAAEAKAPVIGITGSNGKSTVTTLTALMAQKDGLQARAGANIGIPVFDALDDEAELYVLELSSFELETTSSLKLVSGTILNVSEDHLDRYHGDIEEYARAKQRIYAHCDHIIVNRDDPRTQPLSGAQVFASFGLDGADYGRIEENGETWLAVKGEKIIRAGELHIRGVHNELNALSCMALCDAAGISRKAQLEALRSFDGLPHRCQLVRTLNGVCYYNDSKATNVASAQAAIEGLRGAHPEGIILLAGGMGKGQDFTPLKQYLGREVKTCLCFGKDAGQILALDGQICRPFKTMSEALKAARNLARPGQAVLLSPACASFDQFSGFEDRGAQFADEVRAFEEGA